MSKIYLAGPLFCKSEKDYNISLKEALAECGHELMLPQDNSASLNAGRMVSDQEYRDAATMMVFESDLTMLEACDVLLINLDGRVPDEGACVELGYAYAKGKECFAIKTDVRAAEFGSDNMMIVGAVKLRIASSVEELAGMLSEAGLRLPFYTRN